MESDAYACFVEPNCKQPLYTSSFNYKKFMNQPTPTLLSHLKVYSQLRCTFDVFTPSEQLLPHIDLDLIRFSFPKRKNAYDFFSERM